MRPYRYIFIILAILTCRTAFPQGLGFCGNEQPIDKRTSYNVFGDRTVSFPERFDIEFDLALYQRTRIGYIIRIKNGESNRIYNLFYDGQGRNHIFMFNEEGKSSLMTAEIPPEELRDLNWIGMKISFDGRSDSIGLMIHDRTMGVGNAGLPDRYEPVIVFGRSDHIIDVPSFAVKDLRVGNDRKRYFFALNENEGNTVHDSKGRATGEVSNPEWLINDSYRWEFQVSYKSETVAGSNYNPDKKEIYYFNRDTVRIYDVRSGGGRIMAFEERCPVNIVLGTNFIDTGGDRLYVYEVYGGSSHEGPTVASLDLTTYEWRVESYDRLPVQLHHHSSYFDPDTRSFTIFGGFGHMRYSREFYRFDLDSGKWTRLAGLEGDTIYPRYFSSLGFLKETDSIYIFGGMGNESGEQVVGRKYFYDLHSVDLSTNRVAKLWEIPWSDNNVVPVRGMVMQGGSGFYTLCYPEHFSDSFLRLYRFALDDGSYEILGDSIPIHSDRITTNANLYYDRQLNKLYAVAQEFDDDIRSGLKVYSLAFPPIKAEDLTAYRKTRKCGGTVLIAALLACLCVVAAGTVMFKRLKKQKPDSGSDMREPHKPKKDAVRTSRPNSALLFGDFTVYDRSGRDITYMFSARLRQTFCLILQYSTRSGITSQRLSSLLWPDRPEDKVKNSRGVTINHLRKALSEIDGIELIYDRGCFRIVQTEEFYCDYTRCLELISSGKVEENTEELVGIVSRGKFLKFSDEPMFDIFKKETEQKLEPVLQLGIRRSFADEDYTTAVSLAEAVFNIDPFNEEALAYLVKAMKRMRMDEEALLKYQAFAAEYRKTMDANYPYPFKDLN